MSNLPALRLPLKKARSIFQIVGSAGFVLISLMLLVIGLTSRSLDAQAFAFVTAGLLGVVVFGFFAFLSLRTLARPALIVDDQGIWDNTSGLSIGFIPWEQTLGFRPMRVMLNDLVAVFWADERWAWDHMGLMSRWLNRVNRGVTPVGPISADFLEVTGPQLALMLLAQRRQRRPELSEVPGMPPTP